MYVKLFLTSYMHMNNFFTSCMYIKPPWLGALCMCNRGACARARQSARGLRRILPVIQSFSSSYVYIKLFVMSYVYKTFFHVLYVCETFFSCHVYIKPRSMRSSVAMRVLWGEAPHRRSRSDFTHVTSTLDQVSTFGPSGILALRRILNSQPYLSKGDSGTILKLTSWVHGTNPSTLGRKLAECGGEGLEGGARSAGALFRNHS